MSGRTHSKFVNDIVTIMNSVKLLCGSFGLYPSYVAGILNSEGNSFLRVVQ